ncbi:hypothetical protein GOV08_01860 [Candidatus Woesearchaeota archaeon]|nr:hypothetical protein [Candidatus Woesearchaeota archaeon]
MANLIKFLNPETTKHALDKKVTIDFPRGYPGMSGAGEECLRKRQYEHHFCEKGEINARTQRIFSVGHLFENILNNELKELGYEMFGEQSNLTLLDGRLLGHNDGTIRGIPEAPGTIHVLEIKTMNDKSFKDTEKKGVAKSKPGYMIQMQLYMQSMKLDRALFIAINKNDCNYYIERVYKDKNIIDEVLNKTIDVFESKILLTRLSEKRSFYKCSWCNYKDICFDSAPIEKTCRSCIASNFIKGNTWHCWKNKEDMDRDKQIECCDEHQLMEAFKNNGTK